MPTIRVRVRVRVRVRIHRHRVCLHTIHNPQIMTISKNIRIEPYIRLRIRLQSGSG